MRRRLKDILVEYGIVALVVHYVIGAFVIFGIYLAIRSGWEPDGALQNVGLWAAVYGAYKATMPVRIPVTLVVTPFVAWAYERVTGRRPGRLPSFGTDAVAPAAAVTAEQAGPADAR